MATKKEPIEEQSAEITERIEEVRKSLGLSKQEFCKLIRFPLGTYSNIAGARGSKPNAALLSSIAENIEVNPDWLLTGRGKMRASVGPDRDASPIQTEGIEEDYVLVPRYNVEASAGPGSVVDQEQIVDFLAFKREWVIREMRLDPRNLQLIMARGDSMLPTIQPSDLLLIDLAHKEIRGDGIYALNFGDTLQIKRVQVMMDGAVHITSDNTRYEPQVVEGAEREQLRIIGRVVWFGRSI